MGSAIWAYGYYAGAHPAFIDWNAYAPFWIAAFLPNLESEIGAALVLFSMFLMYWPRVE